MTSSWIFIPWVEWNLTYPASWTCFKNELQRRFLFFKCFAWACGVWMNIGNFARVALDLLILHVTIPQVLQLIHLVHADCVWSNTGATAAEEHVRNSEDGKQTVYDTGGPIFNVWPLSWPIYLADIQKEEMETSDVRRTCTWWHCISR